MTGHWETLRVRTATKIGEADENGCMPWLGALDGTGYGMIAAGPGWPTTLRAHRISYELFVGPIDQGMVVDHTCGNRRCCNPEHLQAVTSAENQRRAYARGERRPRGARRA